MCIFCEKYKKNEFLIENDFAFAVFDYYPVGKGHLLIIPKRHFDNYFNATEEEINSLWNLVKECKSLLDEEYKTDGYNIGINCGEAAGQTVMHLHVHLIPRYNGDMPDPKGGVRGVIPNKQKY